MRSGWVAVLLLSLVTAAAHFVFWTSSPGRRILDDQRQQTIDRMRERLPAETLERLVWLVLASIAAVKLALLLASAAWFRPPAGGGAIAPFGH